VNTSNSEYLKGGFEVQRHAGMAVVVEGLVNKPKTFDLDAIMKIAPLEERICRHRCVERWSMVVPWIGYSLSAPRCSSTSNPIRKQSTSPSKRFKIPNKCPEPGERDSNIPTSRACGWTKPFTH